MTKTVLIIAFHFPPMARSSGIQRALNNVRYLRQEGWNPIVLTASPRAYDQTNESQLGEIPDDVSVYRAFALDAKRSFSIAGRYPEFLAWPDAWVSWWPFAVRLGSKLIRRYRPDAIWSTFPINTANLVAMSLAKRHSIPWIADLRDPISLDGYPPEKNRHRIVTHFERKAMERADHVVFTAEYTRQAYIGRYPDLERKSSLISNGFDESSFPDDPSADRARSGKMRLLHSGGLQPKGRNPRSFFEALTHLKSNGYISSTNLEIVFRAASHESMYQKWLEELELTDIVRFEGHVPYKEAIKEMVDADVLLLFQGSAYNHAVPAKLYEYLFTGNPVLGVLDLTGETHRVMKSVGIDSVANIDDVDNIVRQLKKIIGEIDAPTAFLPDAGRIPQYSRRNLAGQLGTLLTEVANSRTSS